MAAHDMSRVPANLIGCADEHDLAGKRHGGLRRLSRTMPERHLPFHMDEANWPVCVRRLSASRIWETVQMLGLTRLTPRKASTAVGVQPPRILAQRAKDHLPNGGVAV
jgi:hypothetical protein